MSDEYDINITEVIPNSSQYKVYSSQADLDPKDKAMPEMRNWCEKQGNIAVLRSGLILASEPSSRAVQNCKVLLRNKKIKPGKVVPASKRLIEMLLANSEPDNDIESKEVENKVSVQQQRLRLLVREAIDENVTDIHVEVREECAKIRFRKHGELYLHAEWLPHLGREIASVAFNKETDHATQHFNPLVPQNASMPIYINNQEVRLRLASMPAHRGFDMVMRILTSGNQDLLSLSELGYTEEQIDLILRAIHMPNGAVIIAGPTGSGKTSTLASCVQMIEASRKVYTIEDPVEKIIKNATQVPVNSEKNDRSFASMGRAALRMDPDVIVMGEILDDETASVVMRAAVTGHLVFSTLHTSSAVNIITRLMDMGIPANLLGDNHVLVCLIFQRLLPHLCEHCCKPVLESIAHQAHIKRWATTFGDALADMYARGDTLCEHCKGLGVSGRKVIAEVIWVDEKGRQYIQKGDTLNWEKHLRQHGWISHYEHALNVVQSGFCDPLDAEKVVGMFVTR